MDSSLSSVEKGDIVTDNGKPILFIRFAPKMPYSYETMLTTMRDSAALRIARDEGQSGIKIVHGKGGGAKTICLKLLGTGERCEAKIDGAQKILANGKEQSIPTYVPTRYFKK